MGNYWSLFVKSFEFFGESSKYTEIDRENCNINFFSDSSALVAVCSPGKFKVIQNLL